MQTRVGGGGTAGGGVDCWFRCNDGRISASCGDGKASAGKSAAGAVTPVSKISSIVWLVVGAKFSAEPRDGHREFMMAGQEDEREIEGHTEESGISSGLRLEANAFL